MAGDLTFPWARRYDADQLAAFIEDLWGAASGDNDLATLDAIEQAIAEHRPCGSDSTLKCPLTEREVQVLTLLVNGGTYESTATRLGIAPHTVRSHCHKIIDRLGARDRTHAAAIAAHFGWLPGLDIAQVRERVHRKSPQQWQEIHRERAAAMRAQPGTSVDIGPYTSNSGAANVARGIQDGRLDAYQPVGAFTAQATHTGPGRWVVRAHYIGTPTSDPEEVTA
ncbi:helix-turn-helix transcriptional regulator [Streptomyces caeni]|uniref:Helix-turn-helix transcriptional regulator n=1 Tax=Streptomyces caeni TaxID=2307231 RepID=A0ABW4IJX1_9ACTN